MRIHVVGIGAVGNFVAFHLRRTLAPRHSVFALHRSETFGLIQNRPDGAVLSVERDGSVVQQDGVVHVPYGEPRTRSRKSDFGPAALNAEDDPDVRGRLGPIDSLIVTTKAYAVPPLLTLLRPNLSRDSTIVLLHNGMGVYEKVIADVFPEPHNRPNFVFCTNTHGLYSSGFLHTVHSGIGQIRLGIVPDSFGRNYEASYHAADDPLDAQLSLDDIADISNEENITPRYLNLRNTIAALVNAPGLRASWEPFHVVQIAMRSKLVVNAFVNPVTALLQCKNGEVLKTKYGRNVADRVCREAERIYRIHWDREVKEQLRTYTQNPSVETPPPPFPRALEASVMMKEIERVVEQTKNNYSSMYMDVKLRRPTEIAFLNGYLVKMADKAKFRPFMNVSLLNHIKMREMIPLVTQP
ncbi:ketopantoate reductase-like protein [Cubamyces lactineus]|nr:ketopantoate reductase-like protein [Cubamyces lactineus]